MTLIPDLATFKKYVPVNTQFEFVNIQSFISKGERTFIKSAIGKAMFDELVTAKTGTPTEDQAEVISMLENSSANAGWGLGIYHLSISISAAGVSVTNNEHIAPVSDAKLKEIQRESLNSALTTIEEALDYMENNPTDFSTWINSSFYTVKKYVLVSSVGDFQRTYHINNSRRMYLKLVPFLEQFQNHVIRAELGDELLDKIIEDNQTETGATGSYLTLLTNYIQPLLVYGALYLGIQAGYMPTSEGIEQTETYQGEKPSDKKKMILLASIEKSRDEFRGRLSNYLKDNAGLFPEFPAPPTEDNYPIFKNTEDSPNMWLL